MEFANSDQQPLALRKLYEQKERAAFCDLTLIVVDGGRVLKAHRSVLAAGSPYFDSILKEHKVTREQLTVSGCDAAILDHVIDYMYTGRLSVHRANVEQLLRVADHFLVTKIVEYCIEFLGTKLHHDNCLFTYYLTQRFKLKQLGRLVENWIDTHLPEVCDGDEIRTLATPELQEFLRNKVFTVSINKLLKIISDWALRNVCEREQDLHKIFACVSWMDIDANKAYELLNTSELYKTSEIALFQLLHHFKINNVLLDSYEQQYNDLHSKYETVLKAENNKTEEKITISEKDGGNVIIVKPQHRDHRKEQLLARLLAGLKPALRIAAIKAIRKKNKKIRLVDYLTDNIDVDSEEVEEEANKTNMGDAVMAALHRKDVTYKCGICNFVCHFHGDYLNHTKTHFSGPPFRCDYCEYDTDHIATLIAHRAKHIDEAVHQCTFCAFKCRSQQNYVAHLRLHAPPEKRFGCDRCERTFKHQHNLDAHMTTHVVDKTLDCDSCGFHTKLLSHMIAHKRLHAGDMYRCSYPHCKYSTAKKTQLLAHAKTHNGQRPHACAVCGRGFMEKSHLVRHERIHLEDKPFKCTHCDYASSRRDKLKEHFTRHHGENASAKVPYKARPLRTGNTRNCKQSAVVAAAAGSQNQNHQEHHAQQQHAVVSDHGNFNGSHDVHELMIHHQNGGSYHQFGESGDFHHHAHANVNHQLLCRPVAPTATTTAAAVAAAMMLDPRFHHNSTVAYPTPMAAMASQHVQQHQQPSAGEYSNCLPLF